jgi:hypothetical protein
MKSGLDATAPHLRRPRDVLGTGAASVGGAFGVACMHQVREAVALAYSLRVGWMIRRRHGGANAHERI